MRIRKQITLLLPMLFGITVAKWEGIWIFFVSEFILVETCSHTKQTTSGKGRVLGGKRQTVAYDSKRPNRLPRFGRLMLEITKHKWAGTDRAHDMLGMLADQGERQVRPESVTTRIGAMNLYGKSAMVKHAPVNIGY